MSDLQKLADEIADSGIDRIFGIPGSGSSYTLLDALEKRNVDFTIVSHEASAAVMAGAYGRMSGKAGVALSIKGPGLANMLPGLAACRLEALPIVSMAECYPPDTPATKAHKNMDHAAMLKAVTKCRHYLSDRRRQFPGLCEQAQSEVPGPVHLELVGGRDSDISQSVTVGSNSNDLAALEKNLQRSKRAIVIAGTYAIRSGLSSLLNDLRVPVFSTAAAKGVVDETLAHAAGVYTGVGLERVPEAHLIDRADLIVGIGLRHNEVLAVKEFPCVSINVDSADEKEFSGFGFELSAPGTPQTFEELFALLSRQAWGDQELKLLKTRLDAYMAGQGFLPATVFNAVQEFFSNDVRIVLDTGYFCTIGEHACRIPRPDYYLSSGQGRYMGIGVPLAVGAALYDATAPTVVAVGDGSVGMFLSDFDIAVTRKLPLLVLFMTDGYFGSVYTRGIKNHLSRKPVKMARESWVSVFHGMGMAAERVEDLPQLQCALGAWNRADGPLFLELPFDPEPYQAMVAGIR